MNKRLFSVLILLLVVLGCRDTTAPDLPFGRYELTSLAGMALPVPPLHQAALVLQEDSRFLDIWTYTGQQTGNTITDTLPGDFIVKGDSVILFYPDRIASLRRGDRLTVDFNGSPWVYER